MNTNQGLPDRDQLGLVIKTVTFDDKFWASHLEMFASRVRYIARQISFPSLAEILPRPAEDRLKKEHHKYPRGLFILDRKETELSYQDCPIFGLTEEGRWLFGKAKICELTRYLVDVEWEIKDTFVSAFPYPTGKNVWYLLVQKLEKFAEAKRHAAQCAENFFTQQQVLSRIISFQSGQ